MREIEILKCIESNNIIKEEMLDMYVKCQNDSNKESLGSEIMTLDRVHNNFVDELRDSSFVIKSVEDTIILNESVVEVKTNIPEWLRDEEFEVLFKNVSSLGCLNMYSENTESGIKIFAENIVPKYVHDKYGCPTDYSDQSNPGYSGAGIYKIKKDQELGIVIRNVNYLLPQPQKNNKVKA